jgi:hypothetical protein
MIKFEMNFHFSNQALSVNISGHFFFKHFFQSKDVTSPNVSDNVDRPKRSLTTEVKDLKISDF